MWNMCQVCPSSWTTNSVRSQAGSCSQGLVVTSIILQFESVFDMKHVVFKSMCPWQEPEGQQHCTFRKTFKLVYRLRLTDDRWSVRAGDFLMGGAMQSCTDWFARLENPSEPANNPSPRLPPWAWSWCMFLPVFLSHISLFSGLKDPDCLTTLMITDTDHVNSEFSSRQSPLICYTGC